MTYTESVKEGFSLIHRNWQLIVIQVAMSVLGCVGFFIIVGVPLVTAFVMLGLDLAELGRLKELLETIGEPSEIVGRYSGIILIVVLSILVYLVFAFCIWTYVLGGSVGVIRKAIKEPSGKFQMKAFLAEGRRLFFPLAGYMTVIGVVFMGAVFMLGILGGVAAAVSAALGGTTAELFFKIFSALSGMLLVLVVILGLLVITVQGVVLLVFEGAGPISSFKGAYRYLWKKPDALGLYSFVLTGCGAIYFLLVLAGYPFKFIPLIGAFLSIPYQLLSQVLQGYFCLVALATVSAYFRAISPGSTGGADTFQPEASLQGPLPRPLDRTQ